MFLVGVTVAFGLLIVALVATISGQTFLLIEPLTGALRGIFPWDPSQLVSGWLAGFLLLIGFAVVAQLDARRKKSKSRFEMVVAAEVVVVFGIATLVLSIGAVVAEVIYEPNLLEGAGSDETGLSAEDVKRLLGHFAEGVFAAGLSPAAAVLLRLFGSTSGTSEPNLEQEAQKLAEALNVASTKLLTAGDQLASAMTTAAEKIKTSAESTAQGGAAAGSKLQTLAQAADQAAGKLDSAGEGARKLGADAQEQSKLIGGFRDILGQIDRFLSKEPRK